MTLPVYIDITREEYEEFKKDSLMLLALESAGVDNWQGYDDAIQIYKVLLKDEDISNS